MAVLVKECPHCAGKLGLNIVSFMPTRLQIPAFYLHCSSCEMPSIALAVPSSRGIDAALRDKSGRAINPFISHVVQSYPTDQTPKAPEHIPEDAQRVFLQAADNHRRMNLDTAAMGFRRVLEIALKVAAPDLKGQLGPRVDQLASKNILTPAMQEWAQDVRVLGNAANHDPPEPTAENVAQLHLFVESLLEYLFTLPEKVRRRRGAEAKG